MLDAFSRGLPLLDLHALYLAAMDSQATLQVFALLMEALLADAAFQPQIP